MNIKILITRSCLRILGQVTPGKKDLEGEQKPFIQLKGMRKGKDCEQRMETGSSAV